MKHVVRIVCGLLPLSLMACATANETNPVRTATEQLLVTHAAERAAAQFALALPDDASVFLDTSQFAGEGSTYAASALREAMLARGARLAEDKASADIVVEVRLGALSIDGTNRVVGVPRLTLPVTTALNTVTVPELSVYSRRDRSGVAEFSAFAYDNRTGKPILLGARFAGTTKIRSHTLFMILAWGDLQVRPGDPNLATDPWWKVW